MNIISAFTHMGFTGLHPEKDLNGINFKAACTSSKLKFCNRVQVYHPLTLEEKKNIADYYKNIPYVYFVMDDNLESIDWAERCHLKKLVQFPIFKFNKENEKLLHNTNPA